MYAPNRISIFLFSFVHQQTLVQLCPLRDKFIFNIVHGHFNLSTQCASCAKGCFLAVLWTYFRTMAMHAHHPAVVATVAPSRTVLWFVFLAYLWCHWCLPVFPLCSSQKALCWASNAVTRPCSQAWFRGGSGGPRVLMKALPPHFVAFHLLTLKQYARSALCDKCKQQTLVTSCIATTKEGKQFVGEVN